MCVCPRSRGAVPLLGPQMSHRGGPQSTSGERTERESGGVIIVHESETPVVVNGRYNTDAAHTQAENLRGKMAGQHTSLHHIPCVPYIIWLCLVYYMPRCLAMYKILQVYHILSCPNPMSCPILFAHSHTNPIIILLSNLSLLLHLFERYKRYNGD